MKRLIYWSRALDGEEAEARANLIETQLKDAVSNTDMKVEVWDDVASDADFFDRLDKCKFEDLSDGLIVVLDRVTRRDFQFSPISMFDVSGIDGARSPDLHQEKVKQGAASALVLRYPFIWPIFIATDAELNVIRKDIEGLEQVLPEADGFCDAMHSVALQRYIVWSLNHHVLAESELRRSAAAKKLPKAMHAPALGAMPMFDPTGLRTLMKALLLYSLLVKAQDNAQAQASDKDGTRRATIRGISELLDRLRNPAVIVEEEADFAYLAAYSAYRHGRRAWTVTNFKFFCHGAWRDDVLWSEPECGGSGLVLRDYDLRFVDLPLFQIDDEQQPGGKRKLDLQRIADWRCGNADPDSSINVWIDHAWWRTCSNYRAVKTPAEIRRDGRRADAKEWRTGVFERPTKVKNSAGEPDVLVGVRKPISHILFITSDLEDSFPRLKMTSLPKVPPDRRLLAYRTLLARWDLRRTRSGSGSRHAPPPVNLEIASNLLERGRALRPLRHPRASLHAAIASLEAYEILMGKSQSTSMEALQQLYLAESELETQGIGLSSRIQLWPKVQDIDLTLKNVFEGVEIEDIKRERDYSAKTWSGIRTIFRNADMFQAASEANLYALTSQSWMGLREHFFRMSAPYRWRKRAGGRPKSNQPRLERRALKKGRVRVYFAGRRKALSDRVKTIAARIATDPGEWIKAFLVFWLSATAVRVAMNGALALSKGRLPTFNDLNIFTELGRLLTASLTTQFAGTDMAASPSLTLQLFQIVFLAINTMFMAFLIAMVVRQVTRD